MKRYGVMVCVPFLAMGLVLSGCGAKKGGGSVTYEFTEITRGSLEKTVSSSGSLKPVATVNVLARMSGKVEKIYVDYNDIIHAGDVLAELNTDMLRLQREQQYASVLKARANYELEKINFQNQEKLAEKNLISEYELKSGRTSLEILAAELSAAEANLRSIDTEINQYAYITSPIDGIVLERNISVGDTAVEGSSSNSKSLFTLAENLEEMQIEATVGELDVSGIRTGQEARFTLEALPGKQYTGEVASLHLMPAVSDNVVTYTVIVNVENRDGALLPGMTAAVDFILQREEGVLLVSNAALRYQPTGMSADEISEAVFNAGIKGLSEEDQQAAREARERAKTPSSSGGSQPTGAGGLSSLMGGAPRMPGGPPPGGRSARSGSAPGNTGASASKPASPRTLWYINGAGKPEPLQVFAGISDGTRTAVRLPPSSAGELEGMRVILREKI